MTKATVQLFRFAVTGVIGLGADVLVLYGAMALGCGPYPGRLLSFLAAVCVTWRINRRYTFTSTGSQWREWWRYLAAMSGGALLNLAAYSLTLWLMPAAVWLPALGVAIGSLSGMLANFFSAKFLVFKS
ncbi:GtrA family protein [Pseudoduganella sp. FT26W]|uniref:GtrA family protein n=1 Tax=Duganella aquatilis TaxID=2666082 RepID=A0A844D440_9BURK|nr:GtrA family protein [Duganella aquatilis]MRW86868.1 GtrA family protein [Duganella aquatilis]